MRVRALHPGGKTPRKKIDVAWQFSAAVIEYLSVGVQNARLKQPAQISLPPQAGIWNAAREPPSAGLPRIFGGPWCCRRRRKIYCFGGTLMKTRDSLVRAAVVTAVALFILSRPGFAQD